MYPRWMPGGSKAAQTRETLLRAAAHEVWEHGYAGASLSGIAGRLGLTKGALAYHLPTKDRILTALSARMSDVLAGSDSTAGAVFPGSPSRRLMAFTVTIGYWVGSDMVSAAAISLLSDPSVPREIPAPLAREWIQRVAAHLEAMAREEGARYALDVDDAAEYVVTTNIGSWAVAPYRPRSPQRPRMQFTQLALEAIGVSRAESEAMTSDVLAAVRDGRLQMVPVQEVAGTQLHEEV